MNLAYSIKVNPKKMKKLEKEYTVIKTKEQSDIAVLRVRQLCTYMLCVCLTANLIINIFTNNSLMLSRYWNQNDEHEERK